MKVLRNVGRLLVAASLMACAGLAGATTLNVYNWADYMNPAIIKAFEAKYDVKVSQSFFNSNPEMFAKLRASGGSQYDVVVPSSYFVPRLITAKLLQPLDKALVPNVHNLGEKFRNPPYDPHDKYSVPYLWGDTGFVYNAKLLPDAPDSLAVVYDPEINPKYPFAIATDAQVEIRKACAYLGYGYDCAKRSQWKKAAELIAKTVKRPNFKGYVEGTAALARVARGNLALAIAFNGDYVRQKKNDPKAYANIKFLLPKEGNQMWIDTMVIPAHAPHPKLANEFINFILDAKIGAELANYNMYSTPNQAAAPYLDPELAKPPILPTPAQMKTLHLDPILGGEDLQFMQQLWTAIRSQ